MAEASVTPCSATQCERCASTCRRTGPREAEGRAAPVPALSTRPSRTARGPPRCRMQSRMFSAKSGRTSTRSLHLRVRACVQHRRSRSILEPDHIRAHCRQRQGELRCNQGRKPGIGTASALKGLSSGGERREDALCIWNEVRCSRSAWQTYPIEKPSSVSACTSAAWRFPTAPKRPVSLNKRRAVVIRHTGCFDGV